ncbi:MAG: SRPBCC family protein [Chloroflexi bacterium]|nr:SRPBCC family protein [Chloroflexota bacterium]
MATYRFTVDIVAPVGQVFDLWTDAARWHEWIEGVSKVTDMSGPPGQVGTRYTVWFGGMRSPSEIVEAERSRFLRTRFGNRMLRGETLVTFEPTPDGTRLTQEFRTEGIVPAISARIFAIGSYRGSFRGELNEFVRIAEREVNAAR